MSITIKRNTGLKGMTSKIFLRVNGENIAGVNEKQTVKVDVSKEKVRLKATQLGYRSNEIEVREGDTIEIKPTTWYQMHYPLSIMWALVMIFMPNSAFKVILLISLLILVLDPFRFFVKEFIIKTLRK